MKLQFVFTLSLVLLVASLHAQEFTPITKLGEPFRSIQASEKQWKYFQLDVDAVIAGNISDTDYLTFLVTPFSGDVDLYVSKNNFPQSTDCQDCWSSTSPHGDVISIAKSDRKWPTSPAKFYVGCYSRTPSVFSFNTWLTCGHVHVYDGEPQTSSTIRNQHTYFEFYLDEAANFSITVTPISGDPDLFVSTIYTKPNSTAREWSATEWGLDIVSVVTTNPHYKAPGWYYISVYAYLDTYFTLTVSKFNSYTILPDSVPIADYVPRTDYRYFKFYLSEDNLNLVINANPVRSRGGGDPDIYVNFDKESPKPSRTNFQWSHTVAGSDTLTIPSARKGWYYIAIYGWSATVFDIYASVEGKNILLLDGIPVRGGVAAGAYTYYKFYHGDVQSGLTFTTTLHGTGNAKMFISTIDSRPKEDKHEYVGFRIGNELINYFATPKTANYYVGILGVTNCNFTIQAVTNQSYTLLREGEISYFNYAPSGYYRYFVFDSRDTTQDAIFSVNPWNGEVDLYADLHVHFPSRLNSTYRSETYKADTLVVPAADMQHARRRRVYIAVLARSDSYFSITASLSNSTQTLSDGIPIGGAVTIGGHRYYRFYNPNENAALTIQLDLVNPGTWTNADLYASAIIKYPNEWEHTWKSAKFGNDFLQIDFAPKGWIYVAVHGASGVGQITYRIVAHVSYTYLWPNSASTLVFSNKNTTQTFRSLIWGCDYVLPAVTLVSGRTSMYISTNATTRASETNYKWKDLSWPGNAILIRKDGKNFSDSDDRRYWSISVQSPPTQSSNYFISLICVRSSYYYLWSLAAQVQEGIPRLGIAPSGNDSILYAIYIPGNSQHHVAEDYLVYIRVFEGYLRVKISQHWQVHPAVNATFESHGGNDRVMRLSKEMLRPGSLFVACQGMEKYAKYEISIARESYTRYLTQDQPIQTIITDATTFMPTYYRVLNNLMDPVPLFVTLESCTTHPAPTIYGDTKNPYPGVGNSSYVSTAKEKYIQFLSVKPVPDAQLYYIGIAPSAKPTQYSIFSSISSDSKPIVADNQLIGLTRPNGQLSLRFGRATFKIETKNVRYFVYLRKMTMPNGEPEEVNMETACGTRYNAKLDGSIDQTLVTPNMEYLLDVDRGTVYMVNVIVQDSFGVGSPYKPAWIVDGRLFPVYPGRNPFNVSVGFILILIGFVLFVAYLLVGSVVNLVRGNRGLSVIPNVEFWKDLPFLVLEGAQVLLFCRRGEYSEFRDETSVNTSGFAPQPQIDDAPVSSADHEDDEAKKEVKSEQTTGYGTL